MVKTIIPNDMRDILSILSFIGFIGIFLKFALSKEFISINMDSIFMIMGGIGLLIIGKVVDIHKWARDGIQRNESLQLFAVVFGLVSVIIGVLLMMNLGIPTSMRGIVGVLALFPAIFIFLDYLTKNK